MLRLIMAVMALTLAGCGGGGGGSAGTFDTGVNLENGGQNQQQNQGGGSQQTGSETVEGTYQVVSVRDSEEQSGGRQVFARDIVYNKTSYASPSLNIFSAPDPAFKDYSFSGSVKGAATFVVNAQDRPVDFYASSLSNQLPADFSLYAMPGATSSNGVASTSAILSVHTRKIESALQPAASRSFVGTYVLSSLDLDGSMLLAEYDFSQPHAGEATGIATGSAYAVAGSTASGFASTSVSDIFRVNNDRFEFLDADWPWHVSNDLNFLVTGKQKTGTTSGSSLTMLSKVHPDHSSACPQNIGTYYLTAWTVSVPSASGTSVTTRLENEIVSQGTMRFVSNTTTFESVLDIPDSDYQCKRDPAFHHMMQFDQITNVNNGRSDIRFFLTPQNQHLIGMELNRADGRVSVLIGFQESSP